MWLMLQQKNPDDFVLATGETHSVREFVELAFQVVGVKIRWEGEGVDEVGIDDAVQKVRVRIDEKVSSFLSYHELIIYVYIFCLS